MLGRGRTHSRGGGRGSEVACGRVRVAGGRESEMKVGDERDRGEMEQVREERRSGVWVGRCHFRYSMEPVHCTSTLVILRTQTVQ